MSVVTAVITIGAPTVHGLSEGEVSLQYILNRASVVAHVRIIEADNLKSVDSGCGWTVTAEVVDSLSGESGQLTFFAATDGPPLTGESEYLVVLQELNDDVRANIDTYNFSKSIRSKLQCRMEAGGAPLIAMPDAIVRFAASSELPNESWLIETPTNLLGKREFGEALRKNVDERSLVAWSDVRRILQIYWGNTHSQG